MTAFLFAISLYSAELVFAYFSFTMRRNFTAFLMFSLHVACYCFLAAALMYLARADFSGL